MALPDPQIDAARHRRRERRHRVLGVLAAIAMSAAVTLSIVEAATGELVVAPGFTNKAFTAAGLFVLAWLIVSLEGRLVRHLENIEGARYRDGYAAGYLDAASRFRGGHYERPSLRPVK
jgi:hypothetical protein